MLIPDPKSGELEKIEVARRLRVEAGVAARPKKEVSSLVPHLRKRERCDCSVAIYKKHFILPKCEAEGK